MKINLESIQPQDNFSKQQNPKDIFKVLPGKNKKYSYLRDVQAEVLDKWYSMHDSKEIVIKMNTGSGKTVVSLLILQSCLHQKKGPVVYVVPDNFLLQQVEKEALELGIKISKEPDDIDFLKQKSILLINIYKLFNAYSVFGVGADGVKFEISTILIDDAHACIDKLESQFTLSIPYSNSKYKLLFNLFESDLKNQSVSKFNDILMNMPGQFQQIPFWAVQSRSSEILKILSKDLENDQDVKWKYFLLRDHIQDCDVVVSSSRTEFSLRVFPINIIPSYERASKIIVSATLPDDTILKSYLSISEDAICNTITPSSASDLGERLILIPEEINPKIKKSELKSLLVNYGEKFKIVIIVPSFFRAEFWEDVADSIVDADNIEKELSKFRKSVSGIIVLVNKYDGIDLPDDDCRILVIDELPTDEREIEKVDTNLLRNNKSVLMKKIRKIEQGMGRSIRSNEDYSIVILLGKSLTNYLYSKNGIDCFTPGTRKQIEISSRIMEQIATGTLDDIKDSIDLVITRDKKWISLIKTSLVGLSFSPQIPDTIAYTLRDAYESHWRGNNTKAASILEKEISKNHDDDIKGWLKYYLAFFVNYTNQSNAQEILKSSLELNSRLVKPLGGIIYQKIKSESSQVLNIFHYLRSKEADHNKILIELNSILEELIFMPDTADGFEESIKNLGAALGFDSQRPENTFGKGPDNLWGCGKLKFFVIECKNGVTSDKINKHDTNQLNGSINWFKNTYDSSCVFYPIMIHPSIKFESAASPDKEIRLINNEKLSSLKKAVYDFYVSVLNNPGGVNEKNIEANLSQYNLSPLSFIEKFTTKVK